MRRAFYVLVTVLRTRASMQEATRKIDPGAVDIDTLDHIDAKDSGPGENVRWGPARLYHGANRRRALDAPSLFAMNLSRY
jgi:hypothetical protein